MLENWAVYIGIGSLAIMAVIAIVKFAKLPSESQIAIIKEMLLGWVLKAEKELGGGTGSLKLKMVYNAFTRQFPIISKIVKFETFSGWVDDSLAEMTALLKSENVKKYLGGDDEEGLR